MARTQGSHAGITGPRIRNAAQHLFAKHGFAAVSMRQIAAEVGVQVGALYNYTADKQTLLFSLLKGHMDDLLTAWRDTKPPEDPEAALEAFVRFHIAFNVARPEAVFISYMELRNLSPEHFAIIEALRRDYEDALEDILRRGQSAGVFDIADSKLTTLAVIAMLTGVTTWYREGGRLDTEAVQQLYWDMARKTVAAVPPAQTAASTQRAC